MLAFTRMESGGDARPGHCISLGWGGTVLSGPRGKERVECRPSSTPSCCSICPPAGPGPISKGVAAVRGRALQWPNTTEGDGKSWAHVNRSGAKQVPRAFPIAIFFGMPPRGGEQDLFLRWSFICRVFPSAQAPVCCRIPRAPAFRAHARARSRTPFVRDCPAVSFLFAPECWLAAS